ncbi:hypothetical protein, partial [Tardiphaga robiniae]|uniref:hypothetical protein n=1 Tax=Tardiphaga robiniae TaxID=943830 RepID=UPI00111205B6
MPARKIRCSLKSRSMRDARMQAVAIVSAGSPLSRRLMLASVSVVSVLLGSTGVDARALNGGSTLATSAPNIASDAATYAAQQAAAAARQTQGSLARAARAMQDMRAVQ